MLALSVHCELLNSRQPEKCERVVEFLLFSKTSLVLHISGEEVRMTVAKIIFVQFPSNMFLEETTCLIYLIKEKYKQWISS